MAGKFRIMVVDDEEDVRQILKAMLAGRYEVVTARNGVECLDKLDSCEPDLFLLDVLMPVMDGFETCVAIRRHPRFREAQVIFLTGLSDPANVRRMYELGGNFYIAKPIDHDRLLRNLEISLKGRGLPAPKRHTIEELLAADGRPPATAPARGPVAAPSLTPQARTATPAPAAPAGDAPPRPRLLVVDDDEDIRLVVSMAFAKRFEVLTAADGCDAIARILEIEPDLLMLDINMPRMNGLEACEALRRIRRFAELPIVFVSAHTSRQMIDRARKAGATDYVTKEGELLPKLEEAIGAIVASPAFAVRPKKHAYEVLTGAQQVREVQQQRKAAERSVDRDYGALRRFIGETAGPSSRMEEKIRWEG